MRRPIPININYYDYNSNNHYEYTPYIVRESKLIIDSRWFASLTPFIQTLICSRVVFELDLVEVPHKRQYDDCLTVVYQSYLDGFDYNVWYNSKIPGIPQDVQMMLIDDVIKDLILNKKPLPVSFENEISTLMQDGQPYFVRLSSTSGKNECPVRPYLCASDVVNFLTHCSIFVGREYKRAKPTYLILMPWNSHIDARNEFRLFIVDGRLTAASPQKWWEAHAYTMNELEGFQRILSSLEFIQNVSYRTFIADVYLDVDHLQCHVIELNPFGAHSGAGSSLFNWITDFELLHGQQENAELRYLSVAKI